MLNSNKMQHSPALSWTLVEKYLSEKTESGNYLALIETEKIFQNVLEKLNFPGKDPEQKIRCLKFVLTNFQEFLEARRTYKKVINELHCKIAPDEIEQVLAAYYKAIEDIVGWQNKKQGFFFKARIILATYLPITEPKKFLKGFAIWGLIFFFAVFLLDSTKFGHSLVYLATKTSHFIFSWVLFTVLLIIGVIIIVIGVIFFLDSKKRTQIKDVK